MVFVRLLRVYITPALYLQVRLHVSILDLYSLLACTFEFAISQIPALRTVIRNSTHKG